MFIILLPLLILEMLIKNPHDIIARVRLSFQLMLFVVDLGTRKKEQSI